MSFYELKPDVNFSKNLALQHEPPLQARAVRIINASRFLLSLVLIFFYIYVGKQSWPDSANTSLFFSLSLAYAFYSATLLIVTPLKPSAETLFHPIQIVIDIFFIILMMHAAGGIQSGLGLLLITTIVTASLISDGRLALFYAAIATIGLLLEQSFQITELDASASSYTQSVMLSLSCFATAWLAYSLAKRMHQSEALASARGVDLENLAQVNELITQEMNDGVIVVDQDFNIRHQNVQAGLLLSLNKPGNKIQSLTENVPAVAAALMNWVKHSDARNDLVLPINNRELKLRFEPINQTSRQLGAVIFIQDWGQMQSAAQQAKLAALGRLTANIAHEIRNPLSAISHANQLLQEEENVSDANTRMLQIIADNTQRIDKIIKDVLELNRRDRTQQEKIVLNEFITDFHAQFCAVENIPVSYFKLSLCTQTHTIIFDQRHLMQILWNLCKNGWEHSRKQVGSLSLVETEIGKSNLKLEVIDDGNGIAEKDRSKLFEPFYTTKTTGNGLGLYISRELAEANSSRLTYQALEHGSAFILQLQHINKGNIQA